MTEQNPFSTVLKRIEMLLDQGDTAGLREAIVVLLAGSDDTPLADGGAAGLRALDQTGLLTRIFPELEPARTTDQPIVHFLPVLAHSLETVAAVEWLLNQIHAAAGTSHAAPRNQPSPADTNSLHGKTEHTAAQLPVAVQTYPELRYSSAYAAELHAHFASTVGRYERAALFKLAALLHDIAKPQTKQPKPGGGVSFHEHQTIGGEVALQIAQRLGFNDTEANYIRTVVREHMRPGQLAALEEVTFRAVQRFFQATKDAGPDVLIFLLADHMATRGPLINVVAWTAQTRWIDALIDTIWGEETEITPPLINGNDIMRELGIGPGPMVGRLLATIGEAQAGGEISTREEALALARRLMKSL